MNRNSPNGKRGSEAGALANAPITAPGWTLSFLRVPLAVKIVGANLLIAVGVLVMAHFVRAGAPSDPRFTALLAVSLAAGMVINLTLVLVALRPLDDLESTAKRIWNGDLSARVPMSVLADPDLQGVGSAVNSLLDRLTADRARMQVLASEVIRAGDQERAAIARELHDSTAQTLAGLQLELSVLAGESTSPRISERVERLRGIVSEVLAEVRLLAHTVHPRVLDDLGLDAALGLLAREAEERTSAVITVEGDLGAEGLPPAQSAVLYRVAQEALNNALRHANPTSISIRLYLAAGVAHLEVEDDGIGFDMSEAERRRPGMGLFTMRERASLADGALEVHSAPGHGSRIVATVPLPVLRPAASSTAPQG